MEEPTQSEMPVEEQESSPSEGPGRPSESDFSEDSISDWHAAPQIAASQPSGSATHTAPQPATSPQWSAASHTTPQMASSQPSSSSVITATAAAAASVIRAARPHFACQGPKCRNCGRTRNTTPYDQINMMITNITCPLCGGQDCGNTICPCFGRTTVVQYGNANRQSPSDPRSRRQSPRGGHGMGTIFPTMEH